MPSLNGGTKLAVAICANAHPRTVMNMIPRHLGDRSLILDKGLPLNGLFACPGLTASQFYIDWLHVADLGVTQDLLGNLLYHLVATNRYLKGTSQEERVKEIFLKMQQYYAQTEAPARLDNLTLLMLRKNSASSPKLRSKAA